MPVASHPVHVSYADAIQATNVQLLIEEMRSSIASGARGNMSIPSRAVMLSEHTDSAFVSMPAYSDSERLFVTKLGTIICSGATTVRTAVNAIVVAYSGISGELIATIDGSAITNMKCAAISALVTELCTDVGIHTVAIIGSGVQARQQVLAIRSVREIREFRIYSRGRESCFKFAKDIAQSGVSPKNINVCESVDDAIAGASIIGTATTSGTPIGGFCELHRNVHINCMGGHTTNSREVPNDVLAKSTLVVEDRQTALDEAGAIHADALEIEDLIIKGGARSGPTIFSSTGHAFYDYCTTRHILRARGLL